MHLKGQWLINMLKLIDANMILRYILGDNLKMQIDSTSIIKAGAFTLPEVIAEVVYVLKGLYKTERIEISECLNCLLDEVDVEHKHVMCTALNIYAETSFDFVDCILIARHRLLGEEVATFDKKLNKALNKEFH